MNNEHLGDTRSSFNKLGGQLDENGPHTALKNGLHEEKRYHLEDLR
jgi:hypothetical protein